MEDPLSQTQRYFWNILLVFSPIEGEGGDGGCGGVLLEAVADVSEYLCLDRVGEGVMVLNLIDSPEAEVGRCHCFLGPSG